MLEDLAGQYVNQTEDRLRGIFFSITVAGAVAAAIFHKSDAELRRATYFAYSGLLAYIAAASKIVWLGFIPAMTEGFLRVLMLVDVGVTLGLGYGLAIIAMARSRDAYGHARMAFLAFIPIANLWLLLAPSKSEVSARRWPTIPLLTGSIGVLTGVVLVIAAASLSVFIEAGIARRVALHQF